MKKAAFGWLIFLLSCGQTEPPKTDAASAEIADAIPVKTTLVQSKNLDLPVRGSGFLTATGEQRLAFKIGGVIRKIYVDEGDVVKAGQMLAVLDKTEIDAQVALAKQALTKAERDLGRVEGLRRDSAATLESFQNATTARDVAEENIRIARFNRKYAEIRASASGKIIKKLLNEGEIVGPGMPVFVVFANGKDDWAVKINVSDRDWARLEPGMAAELRMDAYPEVAFRGKVSELAPAADPSSGLYPVEIQVVPQGTRFAAGLFAQVEIFSKKGQSGLLVPVEALVEGDGKTAYVFVLQPGGTVKKRPVEVAFLEEKMAVIAAGLNGGEEVVTSGSPYLKDGVAVRKMPN